MVVEPFRGLRYAPDKVPLEQVVTQPYDKISREMQDRYYALHPYNLVRIVLGKANAGDSVHDNVYTRAAAYLKEWRRLGVLTRLEAPAFLVCAQRFRIPGAREEHVRKGFIGLGRLEDYANRVVFPHERTLSGPKQDRLELLQHTRTHFEQIFMLYEDSGRRIGALLDQTASRPPDIAVQDEYGVTHSVWIVSDDGITNTIRREMADKRVIIADGHHRYETALAFRNEMQDQPGTDRVPMAFFDMNSPGLTILPTHRIVSGLPDFDGPRFIRCAGQRFDVVMAPSDDEQFLAEVRRHGQRRTTLGVCLREQRFLCALKPAAGEMLDVEALHGLLIEGCLGITEEAVQRESHIRYVRDSGEALRAVQEGRAQISFLLNPTRIGQLRDLAFAGKVMPQKSTDFYPKVLSGLIMYSLEF